MKNAPKRFKGRFEQVKEGISEHGDRAIEIIKPEEHTHTKMRE